MAIDSAQKRHSAMQVGLPWRGALPFPDGAIDAADRQHSSAMYAGIASSVLVLAEGTSTNFWPEWFTE